MTEQNQNQPQPIIDSVPGMSQQEWGPTTLQGRGLENLGVMGVSELGKDALAGEGVAEPTPGPRFEESAQPFHQGRVEPEHYARITYPKRVQ